MENTHMCSKEKEFAQMKIDIAVLQSELSQVKDDIKDIAKDMKTAKSYMIVILVAVIGTFIMDKFF